MNSTYRQSPQQRHPFSWRIITTFSVTMLLFLGLGLFLFTYEPNDEIRTEELPLPIRVSESQDATQLVHKWHDIHVKKGDNLSLIFQRQRLSDSELKQILALGKESKVLTHLTTGNSLYLLLDSQRHIQKLVYHPDLKTVLTVQRTPTGFQANTQTLALESREVYGGGVIEDTLFRSGAKADVPEKLILQMAKVFQWDIDFAKDLRAGDKFNIIYEEFYLRGEKVKTGDIVATEFINKGKKYRAIRYQDPLGNIGYYTTDGHSLKRQFSRTPVKFSRISSHFTLKRWHPVLHRFRRHRGVDYAASIGTPVKATSNGQVAFAGKKGGYGNAIILQHGAHYSTLYGHLNKFAKNIKKNTPVKQGQIIGYVGMTGLASGPHLHYEFRIDGVHRDPLTVRLPQGNPIPQKYKAHFNKHIQELFARMDIHEKSANSGYRRTYHE